MARDCSRCRRALPGGQPCLGDRSPDYLMGQVLDGRFVILDLLGVGGMGAVYRAQQQSMERDVALKVLRCDMADDPTAVQRFLTEARAASRLKNPHTITVFDSGRTSEGVLYIAMELLEGRTLGRSLRETGQPLPLGRAALLTDQVLDSLEEAHSVGVLHRDLKPDNIFLLETRGTEDFAKVLDFGVAKVIEGGQVDVTVAGLTFGTPVYMSPEQMTGQPVDGRSDLYAVGVMLFEMLTGCVPFDAETPIAVALRKLREPVPTLRSVCPAIEAPPKLDEFLARVLSADVRARPETARAFRRELHAALERRFRSGRRGEGEERRDPLRRGASETLAAAPQAAEPEAPAGTAPKRRSSGRATGQPRSSGGHRARSSGSHETAAHRDPVATDGRRVPPPDFVGIPLVLPPAEPPVTDPETTPPPEAAGRPSSGGIEFLLPPDLPRDTEPEIAIVEPDGERTDPDVRTLAGVPGGRTPTEDTGPGTWDRRRGHRSQRLFKVTCIVNGEARSAVIADLSASGGFVHSAWLPAVGDRLEIVFRGRTPDAPAVVARSRVVRLVPHPQGNEVRGFSVRWDLFRSPGGAVAVAAFLRATVDVVPDLDAVADPGSPDWEWNCDLNEFRSKTPSGYPPGPS